MHKFMSQDFLLETPTAKYLYQQYAKDMPIVDYHCHINPQEIAQNRQFRNITEVWLGGDHYKWRQMRSNGIEEYYITGDAPDREKFQKWAETLEKLIGNPLYHWSHLELQRYFGYNGYLSKETAQEVWDFCNAKLQTPEMSARGLIEQSGVTLLCTTDDPIDSLYWHDMIKQDSSFHVQVLPAWRPDKTLSIEASSFVDYVSQLASVSSQSIMNFQDLKHALRIRMDYFKERGCLVSDHGLEYVMYAPASEEEIEAIFQKGLQKETLSTLEIAKYKTALLLFLAKEYARLNWVFQLHFGCKRNNNTRMFHRVGPDTGFDCINNYEPGDQITDFLDALAVTDQLPKTILYSVNPIDNTMIDSIIGCFQDSSMVGKIQHGSAWWFNDHKAGMIEQMTSLANLGMLSNFIGMLTDSRSFLSYTRHEYFRRILCNLVGNWVENGEYPQDDLVLEKIIKDICYNNAVRYFAFDLSTKY